MKRVLLLVIMMMVVSTPVFAGGEQVATIDDLFSIRGGVSQEKDNVAVDKLVHTRAELEECKSYDKRDAVAIAVAAGIFIGSGGVNALIPVVGDILAVPFIFLGF